MIVEDPNPLNVGQTLRDAKAQEKKQALAGRSPSLGKSNVPLLEKGESTFTPLGGCGSRYEDIHGPKWFCEEESGLRLTSSCRMHRTYEVMEARGWFHREFSPQCKVLSDTLYCVTLIAMAHSQAARTAMNTMRHDRALFGLL